MTTFRLLSTALVSLAGATLVTPLASASTHPVAQLFDCSSALAHPREVVLTCADANRALESITWSHWGTKTASARGVLSWNTCTPSCAGGKMKTRPVQFRATGLARVGGRWIYTELVGPSWIWQNGSTVFHLPTRTL